MNFSWQRLGVPGLAPAMLLWATCFLASPSPAAGEASLLAPSPLEEEIVLVEPFADLGERYQFEVLEHRFEIANHSSRPVRILSVEPIVKEARAEALPELLPPGGRGEIRVLQPIGNKLGETSFRFKVTTDHEKTRERKLSLRVFVQSAYDPELARIDFGEVDAATGATHEIELATRENERPLELLGIESAPLWLSAEKLAGSSDGQTMRVALRLAPGLPLGAQVGLLRLRTNLEQQALFEISFRLQAVGRLRPSQSTLDFAWLRQDSKVTRELLLRSRDGSDFSIDGLDTGDADVRAVAEGCGAGCQRLLVELHGKETGNHVGVLRIQAAGEQVSVPWAALVVSPRAEVKDVSEALAQLALTPGAEKSAPPEGIDLAREPKAEVKESRREPAPAERREINLNWKARQEDQLYGYLIYRADSRLGPFLRLAPHIVRTRGAAPGATSSYHYVDREVEPGKTYYYYLDTVAKSGRKERFSGVLAREVAADAQP